MDETLDVEVQSLNGSVIITLLGDVDAASMHDLQAALDEIGLDRHIIVDMSGVGFMDSSRLNVIIAQRMLIIENGGSIHVRNPSPAVRLLLDVTGLNHILYETEDVVEIIQGA